MLKDPPKRDFSVDNKESTLFHRRLIMRNDLNTFLTKKFQSDYKKHQRRKKSRFLNQIQKITGLDRKHKGP